MKTRDVVIFSGKKFKVPQCIQRIDHRYTHGWQVRYGGTKMFSDGSPDGRGAAASLEAATRELILRITKMPTPTKLQLAPSASKTSSLPVGISGPLVRQRRGSDVRYSSLQVLLPQFGFRPRNCNIYIGSENTYSAERYKEALAKAVEMRQEAEEAYRRDETKARRASAREMKAALDSAAAGRKGTAAAAPAKSAAKPAPKAATKRAPKVASEVAAKVANKVATKVASKTTTKAAAKKVAAKKPVATKAVAKKAAPAKGAKVAKVAKAAKAIKPVKAAPVAKAAKPAPKLAKIARGVG